MAKILYYDTETTGLLPKKHCIHSIAGIIEIDGSVAEEFEIFQAPHPRAEISERALQICRKSLDDINAYQPFSDGHRQFKTILDKYVDRFNKTDKFFLAGYNNCRFDDLFLEMQFALNNDDFMMSYFWESRFDVMILAGQFLHAYRPQMPGFRLKHVCEAMGIEFDDEQAHGALYDARKTREVFKILEANYDGLM